MTPLKFRLTLALGAVLTAGILISTLMSILFLYEAYPPLGFAVTTLAVCAVARNTVKEWLADA